LRIARELHDVVAHSMSVIAVQAGVAHHVLDSRPSMARDALATVEAGARSALVEMRRLLGVLRQEGESPTSLAPAPTLADVPDLIAQFRGAGLDVETTGASVPAGRGGSGGGSGAGPAGAEEIPEGVALSGYRIIQEGLTNVLRHGGPRATLRIEHQPGRLEIEISDDGRGSGPATTDGTGHGLVGMRERVGVFGGSFSAGPRPEGGFRLKATLPYATAVALPGLKLAAGT
jgi:signal transduction histidine kinase